MSFTRFSLFCWLAFIASLPLGGLAADPLSAGPLYDKFDLTLTPGHRTEVMGPFFYDQQIETERTWALPPLLSYTKDPAVELMEFDLAYPVLTYERYGRQYRWQLFQLLSFAGGPTQTENQRHRFTIFPLYFQQRSSNSNENYTAVVPFYGHLKNRLFEDEISFVMLPAYLKTRKRDVVTKSYLFPFFSLRHGDGLHGWKVWPVVGHEHKVVTTRTNSFNEVETVPGHDDLFALWPIFYRHWGGLGTTNTVWQQGVLPAYALERSPQRDSTTVLWPFFSHVNDREKEYREWDAPWPLVVFAHGKGKTIKRVWPFFSRGHSPTIEDNFYLWPVYKDHRIHAAPLERRRQRILFFLYSDIFEKNTETHATRRRIDMWPLFTRQRDFNGNTRLQVLAVLEPFLPGSHVIEREYAPVYSFWRSEHNPRTGASSQSLLWNLYRRETAPGRKKVSLFFGLYQSKTDARGKHVRLFFLPLGKK